MNGISLPDALKCWEQGQNEHNGAFRHRPGTVGHNADIYLLTGSHLFIYLFRSFIHLLRVFCCCVYYCCYYCSNSTVIAVVVLLVVAAVAF